jgi:hypothetical protein
MNRVMNIHIAIGKILHRFGKYYFRAIYRIIIPNKLLILMSIMSHNKWILHSEGFTLLAYISIIRGYLKEDNIHSYCP